jgi:hypothetical protein
LTLALLPTIIFVVVNARIAGLRKRQGKTTTRSRWGRSKMSAVTLGPKTRKGIRRKEARNMAAQCTHLVSKPKVHRSTSGPREAHMTIDYHRRMSRKGASAPDVARSHRDHRHRDTIPFLHVCSCLTILLAFLFNTRPIQQARERGEML